MENIALLKERWFKKEVEQLADKGVSKADIARALGVKPQYLNSVLNGSRGLTDVFLDKFIEAYNINQFDLLPRLNDSAVSAMSLRLMEKLDEKDIKIDQLQSELRQQSAELAALKAKYPEASIEHPEGLGPAKAASTKKHSSPPNADNATSATVP